MAQTTSNYYRMGFGLKNEVQSDLATDYNHSALVDSIRKSGHSLRDGRITIQLAKEFGFCYGVDKAVDFAYETRRQFPDKRIFLTTEIIHNPLVNRRMEEMGIRFLDGQYRKEHGFGDVTPQDVVLLPAFGAPTGEVEELKKIGCVLVDTTCGSVLNVWKWVERYARTGFTAVIHGKYAHEETRATSSRALSHPGGHFLVVLDRAEADWVARYIVDGGSRKTFFEKFSKAVSPGFDPEQHLQRVGIANQTTMLSSESLEVAEIFRKAMAAKYGDAAVSQHFQNFDTICSATQDRQDAVIELLQGGIDRMIVIGGYNSSNTGHLCEISSERVPTYHIQGDQDLLSASEISHRDPCTHAIGKSRDWLGTGAQRVGVTAGASTPNTVVGRVVEKILQLQ